MRIEKLFVLLSITALIFISLNTGEVSAHCCSPCRCAATGLCWFKYDCNCDCSKVYCSGDSTCRNYCSGGSCKTECKACGPNMGCALTYCPPNAQCNLPNGIPYCTCKKGFMNCDANPANGCEVNILKDNNHCGNCITRCPAGQKCEQGNCIPICGGKDEPCCQPGNECSQSLRCINGKCQCGAESQPCCAPNSLCGGGLVCFATGNQMQCVKCGDTGQPCCSGNECKSKNFCLNGACAHCGDLDEQCCPNSGCNGPSLECNAGLCSKSCKGQADLTACGPGKICLSEKCVLNATCGDGVCEKDKGENIIFCAKDCNPCYNKENGTECEGNLFCLNQICQNSQILAARKILVNNAKNVWANIGKLEDWKREDEIAMSGTTTGLMDFVDGSSTYHKILSFSNSEPLGLLNLPVLIEIDKAQMSNGGFDLKATVPASATWQDIVAGNAGFSLGESATQNPPQTPQPPSNSVTTPAQPQNAPIDITPGRDCSSDPYWNRKDGWATCRKETAEKIYVVVVLPKGSRYALEASFKTNIVPGIEIITKKYAPEELANASEPAVGDGSYKSGAEKVVGQPIEKFDIDKTKEMIFSKLAVLRRIASTLQNATVSISVKNIEVYPVRNFVLFEEIPKSVASNISEVKRWLINGMEVSLEPGQVMRADPLVVWRFDELESGESVNITYEVDVKVNSTTAANYSAPALVSYLVRAPKGKTCQGQGDCLGETYCCTDAKICAAKDWVRLSPSVAKVKTGEKQVFTVSITDPVGEAGEYEIKVDGSGKNFAKFYDTSEKATVTLLAGETKQVPLYFTGAAFGTYEIEVIASEKTFNSPPVKGISSDLSRNSKASVSVAYSSETGSFTSAPGPTLLALLGLAAVAAVIYVTIVGKKKPEAVPELPGRAGKTKKAKAGRKKA